MSDKKLDWNILSDGKPRCVVYKYIFSETRVYESAESQLIALVELKDVNDKTELIFSDQTKIYGPHACQAFRLDLGKGTIIYNHNETYELMDITETLQEMQLKYPEYFI